VLHAALRGFKKEGGGELCCLKILSLKSNGQAKFSTAST